MHEQEAVVKEAHEGIAGGHFAGDATARKVLSTVDSDGRHYLKMQPNMPRFVTHVRD